MIVGATRDGGITVREMNRMVADLMDFRSAYARAMDEQKLDALLYPAAALPAFKHGMAKDLVVTLTYFFLGNLLHWPAGVVPVTAVKREEEGYYPDKNLPHEQRDRFSKLCRESMEGSEGLPYGVHVMARSYEDEVCLHVMKLIEDGLASMREMSS